MTTDVEQLLSEPLDKVITPISWWILRGLSNYENLGIFNEATFHLKLSTYKHIDCISYGFGLHPTNLIRRAILAVPERGAKHLKVPFKVHWVYGCHMKLYIAYRSPKRFDVFIGSMNLCSPSLAEAMIQTSPIQARALKRFFDQTWKELEKYKKEK